MARPVKIGMDYYPKDTDSFGERKIRKLLKEFSCKGYMIFDYLLCVIYRDKGYYVNYDGEFAFDVADYLGNGITEQLVDEVVKGCVRYGLFNKDLFDSSSILTSSGIQRRYILAKRNGVIDESIRVKEEETQVKTALSTQSKGEEIKEKEIKENYINIQGDQIFEIEKWFEKNLKLMKPNWQKLYPLANIDNCLNDFFLKKSFETFKDVNHFKNSFALELKYIQEKNSGKKEKNGNTKTIATTDGSIGEFGTLGSNNNA